jgi:hypothetical protein
VIPAKTQVSQTMVHRPESPGLMLFCKQNQLLPDLIVFIVFSLFVIKYRTVYDEKSTRIPSAYPAVIRNKQPVPASRKVLKLFCDHIFHHHIFQRKFRYDLFVLRKFLFQFLHFGKLLHIQTAIFALLFVKGGLADAVFTTDLIHCLALILLR